jgi:purine-nucleoside phosphorylase
MVEAMKVVGDQNLTSTKYKRVKLSKDDFTPVTKISLHSVIVYSTKNINLERKAGAFHSAKVLH